MELAYAMKGHAVVFEDVAKAALKLFSGIRFKER